MKYIVHKGLSLHYQRNFPSRLQALTGKAYYRRLNLQTDALSEDIIAAKLTCDQDFTRIVQLAESQFASQGADTQQQLTEFRPSNIERSQEIAIETLWQEYLHNKHIKGKARHAANNDWTRFIKKSGNIPCDNDDISAKMIDRALRNHANSRLNEVKPSTIRRELSLVIAALNHGAQRHGFHWRAHMPPLPGSVANSQPACQLSMLLTILGNLGNDTSCTDVDAVILLALFNITPSEIARIRNDDIEIQQDKVWLFIRDKQRHRNRHLPMLLKTQFLRYSLAGAINLCQMSKGYISRLCAERLRKITNEQRLSLQNLNASCKDRLLRQEQLLGQYFLKGNGTTQAPLKSDVLDFVKRVYQDIL